VLADQGAERKAARERVEEAIREGRLVAAERRYTTQPALEREKSILQIEREGSERVSPVPPAEAVHRRLESSPLAAGQRAAVELIASTSNRIVGVQGYAGTGKSHMLDQARTVVEEQGVPGAEASARTTHERSGSLDDGASALPTSASSSARQASR
jgi:predicted ribonuclease YlaK